MDSVSSVGNDATRRVRPSSMASMASRRMLWDPSLAPRLQPCVSGLSLSNTGRTASCLPVTCCVVDQHCDSSIPKSRLLGPTAVCCFVWVTQKMIHLLQSCSTLLHSCLSSQHQLKQVKHTCFCQPYGTGMESPGCTVPSRVRCTSFLLFSAAIALHHSSPTVNDVTATCLSPVT